MFDALLRRSIERSAREAHGLLRPERVASDLRGALKGLGSAPLAQIVRNLDQLWRSAPGECLGALAPVYGRLLVLEAKHPQAALNMLARASVEDPDVDCEALRAHLLLELNLPGAAREQLDASLARFSCDEGELLWCVSRDPRILNVVSERKALPRDFGLDGRTSANGAILTGWARLDWAARRPPTLRVRDERGAEVALQVGRSGGRSRWPFELSLREAGLRGVRIEVEAYLPDGRWQALPDSPLLLPRAVQGRSAVALQELRPQALALSKRRSGGVSGGVDVVIPVYGSRLAAMACIDAAIRTVGDEARVVVVDDASDDVELARELDSLQASGRITLLRNAGNLGFAQSVNRALAENERHDIVILNSDAVVFGDWLSRLRAHAYSANNVATVTPFTNRGSIASYPRSEGSEIEPAAAAALHALAASKLDAVSVRIPVGVGFCMYVRRDCLRAVGAFDAATFAVGYGEETDFSLRARAQGWVHLLAADTYVYHAGGVSFGARRAALLERSNRILNLRYRGYDRFIRDFLEADPLLPTRRRLDGQRLTELGGPFVLVVTLALEGGVNHFVGQRCEAIRSRGQVPLVLRPVRAGDASRCAIWTDVADNATPNLQFSIPGELAELQRLLSALNVAEIEIQHFLHLDARVIEAVRALAPYDVVLHDYSWICPRVTLIDDSGRYCGEPAVEVCARCVKRNGSLLGERISVPTLRKRSEAWLRGARHVFAPSRDTAQRISRHFADLEVEVRPHAVTEWRPALARRSLDGVTTVALMGAIGRHKGFDVLLACAKDAARRQLPLRFVVIGYTEDDRRLQATDRVFVTGRYHQQELPHLLEREKPDVALFPSVWPETWCYALDEAMTAGLPVVAFDMGAVGERLRGRRGAALLPLTSTAVEINDTIMKTRTPAEGLSSSVQVLPLPPGLYRFSVSAAAPALAAGNLRLPALHVGIAPGAAVGEVEFLAASAPGGWLLKQNDALTVRVLGTGSTLLLTSVREPGGAAISIEVERVEEPPATAAATGSSLKIAAHIRARGDMSFVDVDWAGRVAPGLWIESFSVQPLRHIQAGDIEYKALTGSGFETPWLSDERMCGTRGLATPLLGFAIRLRPAITTFEVEYSGYFQSGVTVGPVRNGVPCRSSVAGDPLEGIQIRVVRRRSRPKRRL